MNGYKRRYKILRAMKQEKADQYKDRLKRKKALEKKLNNLDGTVESNEEEEITQEEELPEMRKNSKFIKEDKSLKSSIEEIDYKENGNLEIIELRDFNEENEQIDYTNNENVSFDLDNQSLFSIEQPKKDNFDTDADHELEDYESDYVSEYGDEVKGDVAF
jgi:hypothetical protein